MFLFTIPGTKSSADKPKGHYALLALALGRVQGLFAAAAGIGSQSFTYLEQPQLQHNPLKEALHVNGLFVKLLHTQRLNGTWARWEQITRGFRF